MTSEKAYDVEQRLNQLLANATDWAHMGAMSNGWTVGGHASYRLDYNGHLVLAWKDLLCGTVTDSTVIWSAANGLPAGFRPANNHRLVCWTDGARVSPGSSTTTESGGLEIEPDGSVQCWGVAIAATRCDLYGTYPLDDS